MRIAVIPARGGSKRIPRKNIRHFLGRPIISYSILTARASGMFDSIYVSTEDKEVAQVAYQYGAQIMWRPADLAEIGAPDCGTQEVTRHAVAMRWPYGVMHDDYACCIYATAPMMQPADLIEGIALLRSRVTPFVYSADPDGKDAGQWYWGEAQAFLDRVPLKGNSQQYRIPAERVCDINEPADWTKAEEMFLALHGSAIQGGNGQKRV